MTIPNLITAHQKKVTVTKLQKAISVISQAYKMSYDENGEPDYEEVQQLGIKSYFDKYWAPYLKGVTYCNSHEVCGYKFNDEIKALDGNYGTTLVYNNRVSFYTLDGFLYIIYIKMPDGADFGRTITVDINGFRKPNVYGKDVFELERNIENGSVQTWGNYLSNSSINSNCSKKGNGYYCAEKIRRAGWQIDKSYPWN